MEESEGGWGEIHHSVVEYLRCPQHWLPTLPALGCSVSKTRTCDLVHLLFMKSGLLAI